MKRSVKSEANYEERREHLAECALPVFLKNGFHRATVSEIARACNMSKGNLYYYIKSKDDIAVILTDRIGKGLSAFVETAFDAEHAAESLRKAIDAWFRLCDRLQDSIVFLYREFGNIPRSTLSRLLDVDDRCIAMFEMMISAGVKNGEFKVEDTNLLALDIYVAGHAWAFRRWYLRKRYTLEQYIERKTNNFIKIVLSK